MLRIYNTLTRKIEKFEPKNPPEVKMYTCGPTVYDFSHIGHMRRYVGDDILVRILDYNGFEVKNVVNITDVGHLTADDVAQGDTGEDKIEKKALKEKKTPKEIADFEIKLQGDLNLINIRIDEELNRKDIDAILINNLKENLPLWLSQDYSLFEIVVVNNGSEDETSYLLRDLAEIH